MHIKRERGKRKTERIMYNIKRGKIKSIISTVLIVALLTGNISISAYAAEPVTEGSVSEEAANDLSDACGIEGSGEGESAAEVISKESDAFADTDIQETIEGTAIEGEEAILPEETAEEETSSDGVPDTVTEESPSASDKESLEPDSGNEIVFPEGFEGMVDDEAFEYELPGYDDETVEMLGEASDVTVDISGTYYTQSAEKILNRLNSIRKEAYDLGYVDRYVPLKWSSVIESAARKRAMEASITIGHKSLSSGSIYAYMEESSQFWAMGENLAWNNIHGEGGITEGINQFYEEKADYEAGLKDGKTHGITGHYKSIINPRFTHVGIAGCQMSCTPNGWFTVAMQLGSEAVPEGQIDETKDNRSGKMVNSIRVSPANISNLALSGPKVLSAGESGEYRLTGNVKYRNSYGVTSTSFEIPGTDDRGVIWASSDPDVAIVENGAVRAVGGGETTITATAGTLKVQSDLAVAKPTTGFTIRSQADNKDITDTVIEAPVGDTLACECIVEPEDAYDKTIRWSSSDNGIAAVASTGKTSAAITLTGCGDAVITCVNDNASKPIVRSFTVRGRISASAVSLSSSEISLYAGESYRLSARLLPEGTEGSISFESDHPEIASVSSDGEVRAVIEGEAAITASSGTLKSAVCIVKVKGMDEAVADRPGKDENPNGVWVASDSIEPSFVYCGRAVTQPCIRVYCGSHRLEEGTDYTLSYKNNIKAAAADSKNAPQVTVNLKGHYQGKKTYRFSITPLELSDEKIIEKAALVVSSTGRDVKPVPVLWFNDKKLVNKTDFTCEYTDAEYRSGNGEHTIKVKGCGNYTGERTVRFRIVDPGHNLGKASVTAASADPDTKKIYFKGEVKPEDIKLTVKFGRDIVPESYYMITALPQKPGKGSITIEATPEGNANSYYGSKTVSITTYADRSIKDAVISDFESSKEFDYTSIKYMGGMIQAVSLTYGGESLSSGEDYVVSFSSNKKVGTAKMTVTGLGRYSGKIVKSYKITPYSGELKVSYDDSMNYVKGGVRPVVTVTDGKSNVLKEKVDYTVSISSRSGQKPGTMTFKIVGKGNAKGCESLYYDVNVLNGDLTTASLTLSDKKYVAKGSGWKSSVKVTDSNGKTLTAGRDYEKTVYYSYSGMTDKKVPDAGTTVYVTVVGRNYYEGSSITRSYRITDKNISSLIFVIDDMTYSGSSIEPLPGRDIHAYASKKDAKAGINELKNIYEVVGSSSNTSSGTGKITVRGTGNYGGTRALKFRILKQTYRTGTVIK